MNPELIKKAQQLIMKEETEIAEALQYHKNKKTGEFTEKGKSLWGFWNPVVRKMKEVLDIFLEDENKEIEEFTMPADLSLCINEALEEHLNKNLMGKNLEKVEIIPGKDFNSYKLKFYYSD